MNPNPPLGPTDEEKLNKGLTVTVRFEEPFDGKTEGTATIGFLRNKHVSDPVALAAVADPDMQPQAFVAFVCNKSRAWAEALEIDDLKRLKREGKRINASFFELLADRLEALAEMPDAMFERLKAAGEESTAQPQAPVGRVGRVR